MQDIKHFGRARSCGNRLHHRVTCVGKAARRILMLEVNVLSILTEWKRGMNQDVRERVGVFRREKAAEVCRNAIA